MDAPDFILVPAGTFQMGSAHGRRDEHPTRQVTLDSFRVAREPVTNLQYDRFVADTRRTESEFRHDARFGPLDNPVVGVNWYDANNYCGWLCKRTGVECRLPRQN